MSRSGYTDCGDNIGLYRASVDRALGGKRGQAFLKELLSALDALPTKRLIADELVTASGECCTLGAVALARQKDSSKVDYEDPHSVGKFFGIAYSMAAEIEYMNDEYLTFGRWTSAPEETPEERFSRMREWVVTQIRKGE